jgi:hypothetical protein
VKVSTPTQWQIIGPAGPVGAPGSAYDINRQCTELNDAANPDENQIRVSPYKVERAKP